ncbi:hypothetical protein AB1Y20_008666 [Prymnesium parvum]|uniref:Arf-GAP with dual PH domain-containing protein 1 n=1 Tax=Prymnesium parvum TaxID=97485 RepID=A0AB34IRS8_PRYPA
MATVPDHRGWLRKQGHLMASWKQRWFVLSKGVLSYYENSSLSSLLGVIPLKGAHVERDGKVKHGIVVHTTTHSQEPSDAPRREPLRPLHSAYVVAAESPQEADTWFDMLQKHIASTTAEGMAALMASASLNSPRANEYKAAAVKEQGVAVSNYKAGTDEAKRNEMKLMKLVKEPRENGLCFECSTPMDFRTAWASINLGVFICIQCSGIHRSLGVHLSKVKMVHGDDWNDDWVAVMERWGNARAYGYWEALKPPQRPTLEDAMAQNQFLKDFIFNKYGGFGTRRFAAPCEPHEWLECLRLEAGWVRYLDEASNQFYFFHEGSGKTEWELPDEARPAERLADVPNRPGREGWMEKKSGGHSGTTKFKMMQKWDRRYFVLPKGSTVLSYYTSDEDFKLKLEALGSVECKGARVFLKGVTKEDEYRFTLVSKDRELKLRARNMADYHAWKTVLESVITDFVEDPSQDD